MKRGSNYRSLNDCQISPTDIPMQYASLTPQRAMMIRDEVGVGSYISIRNQNNLSEVLIYRRNDFANDDPKVLRWDGETTSIDWYDPEKTTYTISNAEELAGFADLVNNGNDFAGKVVKLSANINLNNREWSPIGGDVKFTSVNITGDVFYKAVALEHAFAGTFDGCGYTIYGLRMTHIDENTKFGGFFKSLSHALIKDVIFENVMIDSGERGSFISCVCGYAETCTFVNVIVSGRIRAESCASITSISVDSSFYNCINRASLISKSEVGSAALTVGGITGQISLSDEMISKIHQKEPVLFNKCIQNGTITIYAEHAAQVWAGHLYGCLAHDPAGEEHGIIINRCEASTDIIVHDLNIRETKAVFFGEDDSSSYPGNFVNGIGQKADLLNGLLGKTSTAINVNVIKVTGSTVIDNIVLPGSLNVLRSESFTNTFVTVDTNPISSEDGIANLEPYFVFVKTSKI